MVFLPPPHLALGTRPSYGEAYANILAKHRRSPLTSAASVILLVAPDVDALCATRMLVELLKQDDVTYRVIPVAGHAELVDQKEELATYQDLHTLILINMGAVLELSTPEWFGNFSEKLTIHVIDSSRPQNLGSLFAGGESGERIVVWDDGGAENMEEERRAWEVVTYEPEPDTDEDSDPENDEEVEDEEDDEYEQGSSTGKRRSLGEGDRGPRKRRKPDGLQRTSREERDQLALLIDKHYGSGTSYAQSASGTIYLLATVLERTDTDLLWLAILGLTYQYTTSRISREEYDKYHSVYHDEVARLHPPPPASDYDYKARNPDDRSIFKTNEFRFMLFRHWNLYDAMFHSSYVAGRLGIWKEKGRKRLTGLLAKMGFSLIETQQSYSHMAKDLKLALKNKLDQIAPEYGLLELSYPSFARSCGYISQPLSAGDAVEAISALLEVAGGVKIEVEVEGARNGGEWFGGGKAWDASSIGKYEGDKENALLYGVGGRVEKEKDEEEDGEETQGELAWWVKNFWTAYDALGDIFLMQNALPLAMALQRAIIRQGTSIIDKQDIKTMHGHRVVLLSQGPDLQLFSHPSVLSRLALWLVDALRDKLEPTLAGSSRSRRKSLPFVVACLNEKTDTYVIVGITAAPDFGQVRKNEFGLAFIEAKERCNARTRHGSFDASVIEIYKNDLKVFLETLCEGPR
ncbi:CDC45-like protein [Irpex rosettiformis]|uniref:CDC45-like protein n=1 Tax=Irpex rosettiformis TaxID=378272 RepID=A0ACB8UGZ5_9APHY|nr:CDC45-like protein [Irpex rosettiformis]